MTPDGDPERPTGCPFDPWCDTCPCADDDDVCLADEAERAKLCYLAFGGQ